MADRDDNDAVGLNQVVEQVVADDEGSGAWNG